MAISIVLIGGIVAAACGCGGRREKYDFVKDSQKATEKRTPVQVRPSCGPTLVWPSKDTDGRVRGETHHAKRRLQKQNRQTIRGNLAMMSLEA